MPRTRFRHLPGGRPALPIAACVLAVLAVPEPRAEESAGGPPRLTVATHIRAAQPRVTFGFTKGDGGKGNAEFIALGPAEPGVEVAYGRFAVSASGAFLTDPADHLLATGFRRGGVRDLRTRYHGSRWGVEAHHLAAQGFSGAAHPEDDAPLRPDIGLRATGVTLYRTFDPDSRVYRLSEGLRETGGEADVFVTAGVSSARMAGTRALLPGLASPGSRFYDVKRVGVTSVQIGGGYLITSNMYGLYFDNALMGAYGPQYRTWGGRSGIDWNLAKVNVRVAMGVRSRWFDVGVGVEDDAYVSFEGSDRMVAHAVALQAKLAVFL